MAINWQRQEPGWYTSEVGGISEEKDGKWYVYPSRINTTFGPFRTLDEAQRNAEKLAPRK
jgi:hypothetical protein